MSSYSENFDVLAKEIQDDLEAVSSLDDLNAVNSALMALPDFVRQPVRKAVMIFAGGLEDGFYKPANAGIMYDTKTHAYVSKKTRVPGKKLAYTNKPFSFSVNQAWLAAAATKTMTSESKDTASGKLERCLTALAKIKNAATQADKEIVAAAAALVPDKAARKAGVTASSNWLDAMKEHFADKAAKAQAVTKKAPAAPVAPVAPAEPPLDQNILNILRLALTTPNAA